MAWDSPPHPSVTAVTSVHDCHLRHFNDHDVTSVTSLQVVEKNTSEFMTIDGVRYFCTGVSRTPHAWLHG